MEWSRSHKRIGRILPAALLGTALAGCTAIGGNQRPVNATDMADPSKAVVCPSKDQLDDFAGADPGQKAVIRDNVIYECVKAIDANYLAFKVSLHQESSVTNLVSDIASLGLTTGASLATGKTAQRLAAGGAFVIGSGAAINKDVFYQQTLPAIEASMDARRDRILTGIVDAQKNDPVGTSFTLTNAGISLGAYERAGDIYAAISELTRNAAAKAEEEKGKLTDAQAQPPEDLGLFIAIDDSLSADYHALLIAINAWKDPADRPKLDLVARYLKIDPAKAATFAEERRLVRMGIRTKVRVPSVDEQRAQIEIFKKLVN